VRAHNLLPARTSEQDPKPVVGQPKFHKKMEWEGGRTEAQKIYGFPLLKGEGSQEKRRTMEM